MRTSLLRADNAATACETCLIQRFRLDQRLYITLIVVLSIMNVDAFVDTWRTHGTSWLALGIAGVIAQAALIHERRHRRL